MKHGKGTSTGSMKMQDIDSGLLRQRRNLLLVSITIIIFEIGGGVTIDSVSGLLGTFKLKDPSILLPILWLALPYTMWRYWLYREPGALELNSEFIRTVNSLPSYKPIVDTVKEKVTDESINLENPHPVLIKKLFKRYLDFSTAVYTHEKTASDTRKYEKHEFHNSAVIKVPYFRVFFFETRANVIMLIRSRQYSDYLFPYIAGIFAAILLFINHAYTA